MDSSVFLLRLLSFFFCHLYLVAVSASFVSRGHQLWQRNLLTHCPAWVVASAAIVVVSAAYAIIAAFCLCPGEKHDRKTVSVTFRNELGKSLLL